GYQVASLRPVLDPAQDAVRVLPVGVAVDVAVDVGVGDIMDADLLALGGDRDKFAHLLVNAEDLQRLAAGLPRQLAVQPQQVGSLFRTHAYLAFHRKWRGAGGGPKVAIHRRPGDASGLRGPEAGRTIG